MKRYALPSYPLRAVHLAAVWAYAVSQPIFALLEANPEFLVVRGSSRSEVVIFAACLVLGPPLIATATEVVVGIASKRAADLLHLAFIAIFVAPLVLQLMKVVDANAINASFGTAAVAVLAAATYAWFRPVGLFLSFSLVLPLVGLYLFLSDVRLSATGEVAAANVKVTANTPVVMIVFDEFPVSSLLASDGRIDEERYPNFARLGRVGTWYSAATTVHEHTTHAVPAILDGKLPESDALPTVGDHPENLFTLLGDSYRFRVIEPITHLCPHPYCPRDNRRLIGRLRSLVGDVRIAYMHRVLPKSLASGLPPVTGRWGGFDDDGATPPDRELILGARNASEVDKVLKSLKNDRVGDFERFLASIQRRESVNSLHFLHVLFPHHPWRFLPSGREYANERVTIDGIGRRLWDLWEDDWLLVQQAYQRHLLQAGYTDRLIGRLLHRLEAAGLYEDSLVVVTADHGASFVAGARMRTMNRENLADIARVPLFIKYPGQTEGGVDSRAARTVDILPTIADVLGVRLPWAVDGEALLRRVARPGKVVVMQLAGTRLSASWAEVERETRATLRRKVSLFGDGRDSLYDIGLNQRLLGRPAIARAETKKRVPARVHFDEEESFSDVRLSSSFLPTRITGYIEGFQIPVGVELAVAVNGRIAALTRSFHWYGQQRFGALVPEKVFREGSNRVALFSIDDTGRTPVLDQLGESTGPG